MKQLFLLLIPCLAFCACGRSATNQPQTLHDSVAQLSEEVRNLRLKMDSAIAMQEQQALAVDSQKETMKGRLAHAEQRAVDNGLESPAFDGHWLQGAIGSRKIHIRLHNEGYGTLSGEYYFDDAPDTHYDLDGFANSDGNITVDILLHKEPLGSLQLKEANGTLRGTTSSGEPLTAC